MGSWSDLLASISIPQLLLQTTILLALPLVVITVAKHWSPSTKCHLIFCGLLLACLVPVFQLIHLPSLSIPLPLASSGTPKYQVTQLVFQDAVSAAEVAESPLPEVGANPLTASRMPWFFAIWLAGFVFFGLRLIFSRGKLRRLRRQCQEIDHAETLGAVEVICDKFNFSRKLHLVEGSDFNSPLSWQQNGNYVYLPRVWLGWSPQLLETALCHEICHLKRNDPNLTWLSQVMLAFLWVHPLAWLLLKRVALEQERAADAMVLRAGMAPAQYADSLLALCRRPFQQSPPNMTAALGGASQLHLRIQSLFDGRGGIVNHTKKRFAVWFLGCGGLFLPMNLITLSQTPTQRHYQMGPNMAELTKALSPLDAAWQKDYQGMGLHLFHSVIRLMSETQQTHSGTLDDVFLCLRMKELMLGGRYSKLPLLVAGRTVFDQDEAVLAFLNQSMLPGIDRHIHELLMAQGRLENRQMYEQDRIAFWQSLLGDTNPMPVVRWKPSEYFSPVSSLGVENPTFGELGAMALAMEGSVGVAALQESLAMGSPAESGDAAWGLSLVLDKRLNARLLEELPNIQEAKKPWVRLMAQWTVSQLSSNYVARESTELGAFKNAKKKPRPPNFNP